MCFHFRIVIIVRLYEKKKKTIQIYPYKNIRGVFFYNHLLTRLKVFPILSVMVFFLRWRLHTDRHSFSASEASEMCCCSNVNIASRNENTQLPTEWYILMCALKWKRVKIIVSLKFLNILGFNTNNYVEITMVLADFVPQRIYYWRNSWLLILIRSGQYPSPLYRPFYRYEWRLWLVLISILCCFFFIYWNA